MNKQHEIREASNGIAVLALMLLVSVGLMVVQILLMQVCGDRLDYLSSSVNGPMYFPMF